MEKITTSEKIIVSVTPVVDNKKIEGGEKKSVAPVLNVPVLDAPLEAKPAIEEKSAAEKEEITDEEKADEEAVENFVKELIKPYIESYPGQKRFHITTDGQVFLDANHHDAMHHQKSLKEDRAHIVYDVK